MPQRIEHIVIIDIPSFLYSTNVIGYGKVRRSTGYTIMVLENADRILHFLDDFRYFISRLTFAMILADHISIKLHRSMVLARKISNHLLEVWPG